MPIAIGVPVRIHTSLKMFLEELEMRRRIVTIQVTELLRSAEYLDMYWESDENLLSFRLQ